MDVTYKKVKYYIKWIIKTPSFIMYTILCIVAIVAKILPYEAPPGVFHVLLLLAYFNMFWAVYTVNKKYPIWKKLFKKKDT